MKKAIFITARTGSTRLPNKALVKINNREPIRHLIRWIKRSKKKDATILCTTQLGADDILCSIAREEGIDFFRGNIEDKLDRWLQASKKFGIDFFITADGDDLFCEPELVDLAFDQFKNEKFDFIEAPGLACGAFSYGIKVDALQKVCEIKDTNDTEMMWVYFKKTGLFRCTTIKDVPEIYKRPDIRITLDYPEDALFFETIMSHMSKIKNPYTLRDVIMHINEYPELININKSAQKKFEDNQRKKTKLILKNDVLCKEK